MWKEKGQELSIKLKAECSEEGIKEWGDNPE